MNPNGGATAIGHPPGMSSTRRLTTARAGLRLIRPVGRYALCPCASVRTRASP
ncbi:hypothetical protein [Castellaniella sp.]|uniref:hypothetical protein n=1 Tax=Castellaniella sp. TaxID=1955812 RepID=UPI003A4C61F4